MYAHVLHSSETLYFEYESSAGAIRLLSIDTYHRVMRTRKIYTDVPVAYNLETRITICKQIWYYIPTRPGREETYELNGGEKKNRSKTFEHAVLRNFEK